MFIRNHLVNGARAIAAHPYPFFVSLDIASKIMPKFIPVLSENARDLLHTVSRIGMGILMAQEGYARIREGNRIRGSLIATVGVLQIAFPFIQKVRQKWAQEKAERFSNAWDKRELCRNQVAKEIFYDHGYCMG